MDFDVQYVQTSGKKNENNNENNKDIIEDNKDMKDMKDNNKDIKVYNKDMENIKDNNNNNNNRDKIKLLPNLSKNFYKRIYKYNSIKIIHKAYKIYYPL